MLNFKQKLDCGDYLNKKQNPHFSRQKAARQSVAHGRRGSAAEDKGAQLFSHPIGSPKHSRRETLQQS